MGVVRTLFTLDRRLDVLRKTTMHGTFPSLMRRVDLSVRRRATNNVLMNRVRDE